MCDSGPGCNSVCDEDTFGDMSGETENNKVFGALVDDLIVR